MCGGAHAPFGYVVSQMNMGPFWNDPSLVARGGGGVKFAHDIQVLRLFLKKQVAFAWMFICMMMRWPSKVSFIVTYLPQILLSIINLTIPYAVDFMIGAEINIWLLVQGRRALYAI